VQNWFINARGRSWRKSFNQERFANQIKEKLLDKSLLKQLPVNPQTSPININNNNSIIQPQQINNATAFILYTK